MPMPMGGDMPLQTHSAERSSSPKKIDTANAAQVSRGTKLDTCSDLNVETPQKNTSKNEHITCTIVTYGFYKTIPDGVPSESDIVAAIDEMESLYDACNESGRLADSVYDFTEEVDRTVKNVIDIRKKIVEQPVEIKGGVE